MTSKKLQHGLSHFVDLNYCTINRSLFALPNTMEQGVIAHDAGIYDAVIIFLKINIVEVAKTGQLPDNERGVNI